MARAATGPADQPVPIMVGIDGERDLTEHTLDHLAGWRASRPVRIGNDAWTQRQHDVPGDVLDAVWLLRDQITQLDSATTTFLCALADRSASDWRVPDAGIWEGRGRPRHHLSAKLMCWVALDRAVRLSDRLGPGARPAAWARERDAVRAAILDDGVDPATGAFTVAFGAEDLDASALLIPIVGFLPPDDARVRATVERIAAELTDDALVRRWTGTREGGFVLACYWLVEALALDGQAQRARAHFERVTSWANDLGLLSEVVDPSAGGLIGNFPQAFSHIGLINAAWAIDQAERR
jgi:GH15 family glucan-1,4-alpha-glucosidase